MNNNLSSNWCPDFGETYWYIHEGKIVSDIFREDNYQIEDFWNDNMYKTKLLAINALIEQVTNE